MANIIFSSGGTGGDVLPLVRIGHRLKARGHDVTLLSHAYYARVAAEAGLAFAALGPADAFARFIADGPLLNTPLGAPDFMRRHAFPSVPLEYELVRQRYRPGDTLLVTQLLFDTGARLAAEKLGVPLLWVLTAPSQLMNEPAHLGLFGQVLAADVNRLRGQFGLPPVSDWRAWVRCPGRKPGLWPDWFARPEPSWPADVVPVGFVVDNEGETGDVPAEIRAMLEGGEPPILITAGTGTFLGAEFYAVAAEACRRLQRRGILVTQHESQVPPDLPPSIRRFHYLPLGKLMPSVGAVIHHGGRGTLSCALASGIPQVVLAWGVDRPDNATRLQRLGVAEYVPRPAWQVRTVADALRRLTGSTAVRQRCRELARRVAGHDSLTAACQVIEDALRDRGAISPETLTGAGPTADLPAAARSGPGLEAAGRLSPERLELLSVLLKKKREGAEKPDAAPLSFGQERQ